MTVKKFKATVSVINHDVQTDNYEFIFRNDKDTGLLEIDGGNIIRVGETGKIIVTLSKGLNISLKDSFDLRVLENGLVNSGGEVIDILQ
jgi:hypothetical protein